MNNCQINYIDYKNMIINRAVYYNKKFYSQLGYAASVDELVSIGNLIFLEFQYEYKRKGYTNFKTLLWKNLNYRLTDYIRSEITNSSNKIDCEDIDFIVHGSDMKIKFIDFFDSLSSEAKQIVDTVLDPPDCIFRKRKMSIGFKLYISKEDLVSYVNKKTKLSMHRVKYYMREIKIALENF